MVLGLRIKSGLAQAWNLILVIHRRFNSNLSKKYNKELTQIYRNCPPGYHVDHIYPLAGKNSSGLHVPWNLQYLPALRLILEDNKCPVIQSEPFLGFNSATSKPRNSGALPHQNKLGSIIYLG